MRRVVPLVALLVAGVALPAGTAQARHRRHVDLPRPLAVRTIPAVPGVKLKLGQRVFTADRHGRFTVRFVAADLKRGRTTRGLLAPMKVPNTPLPGGGFARFEKLYPPKGRFSGARLALSTYFTVRPRFVDLQGSPVPPSLVSRYTLRSRHGIVLTAAHDDPVTLQRSRVVPYNGQLVSKPIAWSIQRVVVEGADVVNRTQQQFDPAQVGSSFRARLIFYPARFRAHDAVFGFPMGSGIVLTRPDGRRVEHAFGSGHELVLESLPRGEYRVQVKAAGYSFERPVALSRAQVVDVEVISYLDVALVVVLGLGVAIGLLVARRPKLRRRLRGAGRGGRVVAGATILLLLVMAVGVRSAVAAEPSASPGATKLFAYYYIWYSPSSWNRAKRDYPLLGRYSSDETSVMRRHIRLAKAAGINGFLVSWKSTPVLDERLGKLVRIAEQEHFRLGIVYQGLDFERRPLPIEKISADLDRFRRVFARSPAFRTWDRPVVIWTGTWKFSYAQLEHVIASRRKDLLFMASEKNPDDYRAKAPLFDGDAYYWSSVDPDTYPRYPQKLASMAAAVHEAGGLWFPPAAPGFDARMVGGTRAIPRDGGELLRREMNAAQQADPDAIGLISWNEFSENTHVEPSRRYGTTALKTLADIRGASLKVGDDLDSSQPSQTGGINAVTSLLVFLGVGAVLCVALTVRRRRRPASPAIEDFPW
jgi:hypothetical protein